MPRRRHPDALWCGFTAAPSSAGYLDMPEANWVALELAARGIPVFVGRLRQVPRRRALPRAVRRGARGVAARASACARSCSGSTPDAVLLGGASAGGNLTAGAVAQLRDAGDAGARRAGARLPRCAPGRARASGRGRPGVAARAARAELRRLAERLCATRTRSPGSGRVRGFPPTLVVVCEKDGLRPSGEAFARQLADAGVEVALHLEPGADHAHINEPSDPTALSDDRGDRGVDRRMRRQRTSRGVMNLQSRRPRSLRGAVDVEVSPTGLTPLRLPPSARAQSDSDWMRIAAEQASGVRCEFWTAATWIELTVETTGLYLPWVPEHVRWAVFSATVDGQPVDDARVTGGSELHLAEPGGPRFVKGEPAVVRFELGGAGVQERRVVVWLPQTDTVEIRDVRADAPLQPAEPLDQLRWWHHGSSISHCIEAATPRGVWPVAAADQLESGCHQSRLRRERAPRSVHRSGDARFRCRPVQPQDRHQHRRWRHDEAAHVRSRRARLPRHDPRWRSDGPDPRDLADLLPDARRHTGPDRHRPRDRRAARNAEHDTGLLRTAPHPAFGSRDPAGDRPDARGG